MSFPRYPAYKPSGVKWLGQIPEHWGVLQSRRMFKARREVAKEGAIMLTASQKYGMISQAEFVEREGRRVVEVIQGKDNLIQVEPDDFVISMRSFQGGLEWCRLSGSTSFHYVPVTPVKHVVPSFFAHLLKSERYISALRSTTNLIRDGQEIRYSNFVQVPLPIVPVSEQIAIAALLDRETAKIDALIAEQQRLIELLQEKRQAVISHAVTKGLNPNAPMKDSGVEWLEDVPEHWDVTPLMRLTQPTRPIMYGIVLPGPDVEEGVPILKGGNVKPSRMALECMAKTTPEIEAPFARARLRAGDLVYGIRGSIGDCEIVPIELEGCNITQDVARIAPLTNLCPKWLRYAMLSRPVAEGLACGSLGAAVKGINIYDLKRARIPVPPSDEMKHIADVLSSEVSRLLSLSLSAETAIGLLRERRSALISAAVTGQIDVRNLAPDGDAA